MLIAHYAFDIDTAWYSIKEYAGNIERLYTPIDTTMRIHNAIGYYTDSTYYHFIKDHLGNVCAVEIPWPEIVVTSLIFGVILAIGFSKTPDKAIENKTEKE